MLAIDHIVIASKNPEKDAQRFVEEHGVIAIEGGRHEEWGTFNFLAYFKNNCYIEWIGIYDEELARASDNPLIKQTVAFLEKETFGVITYALRTIEMDKQLHHFETNNIQYIGPFPGSRKKLDGSMLSWRMLFPTVKQQLPFLIEWGTDLNLPDDLTKINPRDILEVRIPGNPQIYRKFFQLEAHNETIQLENAKLHFTSDEEEIRFTLGESKI